MTDAAIKVNISDVLNAEHKEGALFVRGVPVTRVRILGVSVAREIYREKHCVEAVIDDGTGQIRIVDYEKTDAYLPGALFDIIILLKFDAKGLYGLVEISREIPEAEKALFKQLRLAEMQKHEKIKELIT